MLTVKLKKGAAWASRYGPAEIGKTVGHRRRYAARYRLGLAFHQWEEKVLYSMRIKCYADRRDFVDLRRESLLTSPPQSALARRLRANCVSQGHSTTGMTYSTGRRRSPVIFFFFLYRN